MFFCYTFFDVGQKCSVQFCERVWRKRFLSFKVGALRFVFIFGSRMVVSVYSICVFYVEVVDVTHDSIDNNRKTTFSTISVLRIFFVLLKYCFQCI